jgi:hypothetical protein
MDPDMVRQQEEAERAANSVAPNKPANGLGAPVPEPQSAVAIEPPEVETIATPAAVEEAPHVSAAVIEEPETPPAAEAPIPDVKPAVAAKKALHPNRRALPPIGTGRRPGEEPAKRRRLRGFLRLFVFVLVGAILGAGVGFGLIQYLHIAQDQQTLYLAASAGGLALIAGLIGILHFDH